MWYVFMFSVLLNECSQCDQDEATETCVAPEDGACNCGDNESLYAYCGGGSADAASLSGQDKGDSTSLQRECSARAFRKQHPRVESAPRDDRSSKNQPKRAENDRDRSL